MESKSSLVRGLKHEGDLMRRHVEMLRLVVKEGPIGIIRLSQRLKMPQHKVRYSLRMLEQDGLVKATPDGAVATDKVASTMAGVQSLLEQMSEEIGDLRESLRSKRE